MARTDRARQIGYDNSLGWSEDSDFFHRYLLGERFCRDPEPVYCYREFDSFSPAAFRSGQKAAFRIKRAHVTGFRNRWRLRAHQAARIAIYETALRLGADDWILRRCLSAVNDAAQRRYRTARDAVESVRSSLEQARCRAA